MRHNSRLERGSSQAPQVSEKISRLRLNVRTGQAGVSCWTPIPTPREERYGGTKTQPLPTPVLAGDTPFVGSAADVPPGTGPRRHLRESSRRGNPVAARPR